MKRYLFIMAQVGHPWGGSEPLWSSAAEHLVRGGNEVRISVKDWGKPVPEIEHLRAAGCQIFYRQYGLPPFLARQVRRLFPRPEFHRWHIRKVADGVDLIIISQGANFDGLEWMEASRIEGHKYAPVAQSAVVYWWPNDDVAERLRVAYDNASASYFVCRANLDLSRLQFGSALSNGKIVCNPFNVSYDAHPAWPSDSSSALSLACVGRLDVISKAQDVLLQVLALPHWRQRHIRLSLIGSGPHERGLRSIVEQLKLDNVEFAGQKNNIEDVWSKHHALVLPSRFEGMPLVLMEAMLCGRPAIVTDVGGNRELVQDDVNGFIAKASTVELLDEAMNRAWDNRDRLKSMGDRAARDVRQFVARDPGGDFARELVALAGDTIPNGME